MLNTFFVCVQFLYGVDLVFNKLEHSKLCVHTRNSSNLLARLPEDSPIYDGEIRSKFVVKEVLRKISDEISFVVIRSSYFLANSS